MNACAVLIVNFVDRADVRMVQGGGSLGFALEAAESLRVLGDFIGQELQGDKAAELHVLGFVDHTHPAATQLLDDAVVRDGLADHLRECYGVRSGMSMYRPHCSFAYSALACFSMGLMPRSFSRALAMM